MSDAGELLDTPPLTLLPIIPPAAGQDFDQFPELRQDDVARRADLMLSIRQTGGPTKLRSAAESLERQRKLEASRPAAAGRGRGAGRGGQGGDLMRDLSAQLQRRGRAAPLKTVRR